VARELFESHRFEYAGGRALPIMNDS